jgi:uncharacterized protein with PQ loop repeat
VYNTLFDLIILCIFVFSCLLFCIYSIEKNKNQKTKKKKKKTRKQNLPQVESAVGLLKPLFQLAVATSQPVATHTDPAATVAILPLVETGVGTYRRLRRR